MLVETTEVVDQVEVPAPPSCSACADSGEVAPDAFGDWVPWPKYVADSAAKAIAEGWPPESSAIAVGMLHPMPCPKCQAKCQAITQGDGSRGASFQLRA